MTRTFVEKSLGILIFLGAFLMMGLTVVAALLGDK
jgi:hypothetical protein